MLEMLPAGHELMAAQFVTFLREVEAKQSIDGIWHESYLYSIHAICWVTELATALLRYCAKFPTGAACDGAEAELAHRAQLTFDGQRNDLAIEMPNCMQVPNGDNSRKLNVVERAAAVCVFVF